MSESVDKVLLWLRHRVRVSDRSSPSRVEPVASCGCLRNHLQLCCCCTVLEYSTAVFASWVLMCVYIFQSIKPYLKSADHSTGFSSRLQKPPLQVFRFPSLPVGLQLVPNLIKNFIEHYSEHTQTELRHLSLNQALSVTQPAPCAIYRFQAYWNLSYMFCLGGALCSPCCRRPWTLSMGRLGTQRRCMNTGFFGTKTSRQLLTTVHSQC